MVTTEMNAKLLKKITRDDIKEALMHMVPLKSLGTDGFNADFYQSYWHIVRDEVSLAALNFLNDDLFDSGINHTHVVPICKIKDPTKANDFQPISLCNVIYKIVIKTLANRLKQILPYIISKSQNAFIPERLITNNVIVACKVLHTTKTRQKERQGSMAIKLDISKAYDRIE